MATHEHDRWLTAAEYLAVREALGAEGWRAVQQLRAEQRQPVALTERQFDRAHAGHGGAQMFRLADAVPTLVMVICRCGGRHVRYYKPVHVAMAAGSDTP